jgi:hypothetical protein
MDETEKLQVLLPHWIEHNCEHAQEFREYAVRSGEVPDKLLAAGCGLLVGGSQRPAQRGTRDPRWPSETSSRISQV